MARWNNQRRSDNVQRRSAGRAAGGTGLIFMLLRLVFTRFGIMGVVVVAGGYFLLKSQGIDPLQMLAGGGSAPQAAMGQGEYDDEIRAIVGSTEDFWTVTFEEEGLNGGVYPAPMVNIFSQSVQTACGYAPSSVGPFYCPADQQVYFDTSFFKELETRFSAGGDFPKAYVIAHEVGHHVQTVIGISAQVRSSQSRASQIEQNQLQVRMELQADCYAGLWASSERGDALEPGDIDEALRAASAIGDDTLQLKATGTVKPETFTHGTSDQRRRWFYRGFENGSFRGCDAFNMPYTQL